MVNAELQILAKEQNEAKVDDMWDELILLPQLMADPRFYGPDVDEGVWPWEK